MQENHYFIVDDVITETGREGFEVMYGNPFNASGISCAKFSLFRHAKAYCNKHAASDEIVYRVRLARRHGAFSCKMILRYIVGGGERFPTLQEAIDHANMIYMKTGYVLAVEAETI